MQRFKQVLPKGLVKTHIYLIIAVAVAAIVAAVGFFLIRSSAAGFFASLAASQANVTGNAQLISDATAFDGKAVLFKAPPTSPPTTPPTGTLACPAWPSFPDQNCTGWEHTGVTLHNCDDLIDSNGTDGWIWDDTPTKTFDSCYFSGNLTVQAAGVTITRSQVHGSISPHWSSNYSLRGLTLVDVEIEQEGVAVPRGAVGGNDWSCLRCDAHHGVTGMHFGDNTTIRDSYVHDMQWLEESHGSGIATGQDHGSNSSIIHNNIQCNRVNGPPICSSALSIYPEDDNGDGITVHNVQVEKNLFNASGAYCVYAVDVPGSNVNFIDNYFGKKFYPGCAGYGPVASYSPLGGQWIGNVWADGSGPVVP